MPRRLPRGCIEDVDRYGKVRVYLRQKGRPKVRLHGTPWTEPFMDEYEKALAGRGDDVGRTAAGSKAGTWRWLCERYFLSAGFRRLDARTQRVRRQILEATCDEPTKPGAQALFRDFPIAIMTAKAVRVLRDRKLDTPEAANGRVKAIRQVFAFALEEELAAANPARDVPYLKSASQGFHAWTLDEVRQFEARHPIGSKPRLALALLLFTGQRRSDVIRFGRQMVRDGKLSFTQFKNRNRKPKRLVLPMLQELAAIINASPCGDLTYLVTEFGKPFSDAGFGNWFRVQCDRAALPHCSAHGLRKAGATIAANAGASERTLMSIFGWDSSRQAAHYTRSADQERLAGDGMRLLVPTGS
ncbi:MAG: tyrosine-type recombinase/integrase [Hyphomicrobiales bacterium]|nr:tyrosine-type recombinase/integrase [Hyphomicrobiales bacterium]